MSTQTTFLVLEMNGKYLAFDRKSGAVAKADKASLAFEYLNQKVKDRRDVIVEFGLSDGQLDHLREDPIKTYDSGQPFHRYLVFSVKAAIVTMLVTMLVTLFLPLYTAIVRSEMIRLKSYESLTYEEVLTRLNQDLQGDMSALPVSEKDALKNSITNIGKTLNGTTAAP